MREVHGDRVFGRSAEAQEIWSVDLQTVQPCIILLVGRMDQVPIVGSGGN